jgi:hypothetical protein
VGLEVRQAAYLFSRVLEERFSAGVRAGLISVAATCGVLAAYGLRAGSLTDPFLFLGRHLGGFRDAVYPQSTVVLAGFLLHGAWIVAWCVGYALVAPSIRRVFRLPLAIVVVSIAFLGSSYLIGSALESSQLGGSRWILMHVVFGMAMYLGTRIANEVN